MDLAKFYPRVEIVTEENLIGHHRVRPGGEAREAIYARNRPAVQKLLSSSRNGMDRLSAVPGFFQDPGHCRHHFESTISNWIDNQMESLAVFSGAAVRPHHHRRVERWSYQRATWRQYGYPAEVFQIRKLSELWHSTKSGILRTPDKDEPPSLHIKYRHHHKQPRSQV